MPFIFQRNDNGLSDCGNKVQNQIEQAKSTIIQLLSFFLVENSFHRNFYYFIRVVLCLVLFNVAEGKFDCERQKKKWFVNS